MTSEKDMLTLPFSADDRAREEGLVSKPIVFPAGHAFIRPDDAVETLYQLLEGTVHVVRDLGTAKAQTTKYRRTEPSARGIEWTPILGARYFFLKKPSSMHYVAMTDCSVAIVAPVTIRKLYAKRDCVKLVREIIRNSDMPLARLHEELDKRYDALYYSGFRKEDLEGLLSGAEEHVAGDTNDRVDGAKMMRDAYRDYACDMIFLLMGDMLRPVDDGVTNIEFEKPALYR